MKNSLHDLGLSVKVFSAIKIYNRTIIAPAEIVHVPFQLV